MKKNTIHSLILFLFCCSLSAQELYSENFENFTVGNVSSLSDGQTIGQGGWTAFSHWTHQNETPFSHLFQIENTNTNGKVITMAPHPFPYSSTNTFISRDLNNVVTNRTLGNNIIKLEIDFYTAQQASSLSSNVTFGLGRTSNINNLGANVIGGFTFDNNTGELKGNHHDETSSPIPMNYLYNLGNNNQSLILPFNTWIRCVVYADYISNKLIFQIPTLGVFVEKNFYVTASYPTNITNHAPQLFYAWTVNADSTNSELPTYKFDNIKVTALNDVLSINEIMSTQFNLYPNPSTDLISITTNENITIKQIDIYDLIGKLIDTQSFENKKEIQLNVENLNSGTYLLQLETNVGSIVKKILKK